MKRVVATVGLALLFACSSADTDLNQRVLVRLNQEPTPVQQFTVSTHDRIVRLKGVVHSASERERLERAAREVSGVAGVENQLVVDAPVELTGAGASFLAANPIDSNLRDELRSHLDAQQLTDVGVTVKDGTITLTGNVPSPVHDAAMRMAESTRATVHDEMTLKP